MARAILRHKGNRLSSMQVGSTRGNSLAQRSAHHTTTTIQKARRTARHGWRRGRALGSWRNRQLQGRERSCAILSALGRLYSVQRHMGNHRPPGQLSRQAQRVAEEFPEEATRRKRGLTMTSGPCLPIETARNGAVIWYLLPFLLVAFSYAFFGERFGF